jgi:uncharacterized phiE125 gp8 family phage protein
MGRIVAEAPPLPVALEEVKAYLRITAGDEDALLAALARSASDACEAFVGRALIVREVAEELPASPAWARLGVAPVVSIAGLAALAEDGSATPLAADDYAIDVDAAGEGWARVLAAGDARRVRASYVAGMAGDPNGLPEALRHGIVRLTAHLYAHRDDADAAGPPAAVTALWRPWRRLGLGGPCSRR